jgi:Zn-dependent membrane protease YugP
MFVMTGMLIMASVVLVICLLIMSSVVLVIGVVLVLSYDRTNRSIARVASAIILSAEAASPAADASWTQ